VVAKNLAVKVMLCLTVPSLTYKERWSKHMEFKKTDPRVAKFVYLFREYRGRKPVRIREAKSYHVSDYWSEGSRTYCFFVDATTGEYLPTDRVGFTPQTAANPFGLRTGSFTMKPGIAVVENVIFCGKDLGIRVVLHPDDYAKWSA